MSCSQSFQHRLSIFLGIYLSSIDFAYLLVPFTIDFKSYWLRVHSSLLFQYVYLNFIFFVLIVNRFLNFLSVIFINLIHHHL